MHFPNLSKPKERLGRNDVAYAVPSQRRNEPLAKFDPRSVRWIPFRRVRCDEDSRCSAGKYRSERLIFSYSWVKHRIRPGRYSLIGSAEQSTAVWATSATALRPHPNPRD